MGEKLIIAEPQQHRVYQRNKDNAANVVLSLAGASHLQGRVEARLSGNCWAAVGQAEQGRFQCELGGVQVGEHRLAVRILDADTGAVLAEAEAGPFYVGDLWVLGGQSNMEGCGRLVDVEQPQAGVSCFYMDDRWAVAEDPLCWALESPDPVHWMHVPEGLETTQEVLQGHAAAFRRDRVQGSGLGIPFGKEVVRVTGIPVGLIMVAHGGTSMAQWDAKLASEGGRSLYGSMLRSVKAAGGKVAGLLWYQGESDALEGLAEQYYNTMLDWVRQLRVDLDNSELPVIYAQLSVVTSWSDEVAWNRVQHDQLRLERALGQAELVPTIDALLADTIHPDTASLRSIGQRMAWAALRLVYRQPAANTGPRLAAASWNEDKTELALQFTGVNGRLKPVDRVFSFHITSDGERIPSRGRISEDGQGVVLQLERAAAGTVQLWHGKGLYPVVNVRDESGIPLLVFGPVTISEEGLEAAIGGE